uniref:FRG domain-containing protein n=1 Tax=Prevotella sp. GTC17260 TaxID=3236796 RepID=A0AB33JDM3_9BACT
MEDKKVYIKSVEEAITEVKQIKSKVRTDLLFRGQSSESLVPKMKGFTLLGCRMGKSSEKLIIQEFCRVALPVLPNFPKNIWEALAIARHYGVPTRLLDWSYDMLIALWFAVSSKEYPSNNEDAILWVLSPEVKDFFDYTLPSPQEFLRKNRTKIYRPTVFIDRIESQRGFFTVHASSCGELIPLEEDDKFKNKITPLYIKCDNKECIRKELELMGINTYSVFHDLENLSKFLTERYCKKIITM